MEKLTYTILYGSDNGVQHINFLHSFQCVYWNTISFRDLDQHLIWFHLSLITV